MGKESAEDSWSPPFQDDDVNNWSELGVKFLFLRAVGKGKAWPIFYEAKERHLSIKDLLALNKWDSTYVELQSKDKGSWLPCHGEVESDTFWQNLSGDGTEKDPFVVRLPAAKTYEGRMQIFRTTPSTTSIADIQDLQGVSGPDGDDIPGGVKLRLWFCHRPHTDTALPAALAYPGFGRIIDAIAQGSVVPEGKDYMAAYRLVHFASKIYETEDLRVRAVNDVLEEYLKRRIFPNRIPAVVNNELKYFRTDSSYFPSQEHGKLFVLNTHGTNKGGEPYFQMIQHYQAQCVNMLQSRALQSSVLPCFGIDYVGPSLRLNALWFASHIQAEPLTPALNLLPLEHYNPYQMKLLALTLRALKDEIPRLEAFLDDSDEHGDESLREKYIGEDLPHAFYTPLDGEKTFLQELTNIYRPDGLWGWQRIWVGTPPSGRDVIIKFSTSYSKVVHEAWAREGLAPKVHYCSSLPGGFWVTAMDVLTEQQGWWNMRELDPRTRDEVLPFVEAKLAEAHKIQIGDSGERGVHEDCREQNIFIRFKTSEASKPRAEDAVAVNFFDFDWAGVEGFQRYPMLMSPVVIWPSGVETGQLILQEHDRALLRTGRSERDISEVTF